MFVGVAVTQALLRPVNPAIANPIPPVLQWWVFATVTVPIWLIFSWREYTAGATPIAGYLGLRVRTTAGNPLTLGTALMRNAVKLVPFELNHVALLSHAGPSGPGRVSAAGTAAVWALVAVYVGAVVLSSKRQSIHDIVAGTVVVRGNDAREVIAV